MKQHEYNPAHIHRGMLFTGLSSVMILKCHLHLVENIQTEGSTTKR